MDEPEQFPGSQESQEYEKPEKLQDLVEAPGLQAGPSQDEWVAIISGPKSSLRKRIKRTRSTLLCFLITGWSLLCLTLLFYVPGRYADFLRNSALGKRLQLGGFAVDSLILFCMVLWFLGALLLFVVTTGFQKDRYPVRS